MEQKSKPISGLNYQKRRKVKFRFTDEEKHKIIKEFLNSDCTKREIWKKYTGEEEEHGQLLRWMRQLGYDSDCENITFAPNIDSMQKEHNKDQEAFENLQLRKRVQELEKQLKDAEMKAIAFSTMVDIAEKELKVSIRKKYNTKP